MPAPAVESDQDLATRLAVEAGQLLVQTRAQLFAQGLNHWSVKDAGDDAAQTFLMNELRSLRPDDAVLSEEGREDPRRFDGGRVWIIDPLDGTREFAERDRVDWAVHIALWEDDHFVAGAVSLPALDQVFAMDPPPTMPDIERARPILITSRNQAPPSAHWVARGLDCDALRLGSAGAKTMA
ncbi:MAG: inositol monophosphatase family protein, partial [Ilumatobacteraceae bacterium]